MLIYIIFFIGLAILAIEYEIHPFKNNWILLFIFIGLALLAGLRAETVDRDYPTYLYAFDSIYNFLGDGGINLSIYEPGFILVVLLFKSIFTYNYGIAIMLFFAFTTLAMKLPALVKLSINPYLVILLYYSQYFLLQEMTQIRIGFASGIFLLSLFFYFKSEYKSFILMVLIASMFHYSALGYLLLLFLRKNKFNKFLYGGLLVLSVFFAFIKVPLMGVVGNVFSIGDPSGKFSGYAEIVQENLIDDVVLFNTQNLLRGFCSIYLMVFVPTEVILKDPRLALFLKCTILSIFLLSFFSEVSLIAFRISDLFGLLSIFAFAYLAKYLPFYKYNIWIVIGISAILFYIFTFNNGGILNPYEIEKVIK